jgi:hypothetical protein
LKDPDGTPYFGYGKNFLNAPDQPRPGRDCEFSALPPIPGRPLHRATEIWILPAKKQGKNDFLNRLVKKMKDEAMKMFAERMAA